jgi:uncharacterized protein (TIGR02466 family)
MQNIFSIPISILKLKEQNNSSLVNYSKSNYDSEKKELNIKDKELKQLNKIVLKECEKFASNYLINNLKLKIDRVWANVNIDKLIEVPHAHRNSFISAVYYPLAKNTQLIIQSPFTISHLAHIDPDLISSFNEYNSDSFCIPVETGMLVIFNSMLVHHVLPTNNERVSIAYDLVLK